MGLSLFVIKSHFTEAIQMKSVILFLALFAMPLQGQKPSSTPSPDQGRYQLLPVALGDRGNPSPQLFLFDSQTGRVWHYRPESTLRRLSTQHGSECNGCKGTALARLSYQRLSFQFRFGARGRRIKYCQRAIDVPLPRTSESRFSHYRAWRISVWARTSRLGRNSPSR